MKKNRFAAQLVAGFLLALATLSLTACANIIYREPQYPYAGRTIPPSGLLQRVMVSYTANGSQGALQILDGLRDRRNNVQNTIQFFNISGYSAAVPYKIINFPEEQRGYVISQTDGTVGAVDYGKEASAGTVASFGALTPSVAVSPDGTRVAGAIPQSGILQVSTGGATYQFTVPNVNKVAINQGNSIILAMVRNSDTLYRVIRLPYSVNPVRPAFAVDCQPLQVPQYCVVPVGNTDASGKTVFNRPTDAYFSVDGTSVYILNCGPECGGTQAGVTVLQQGPLQFDQVPTSTPVLAPLVTLPAPNPIPVPGGVTVALSGPNTLYVAGQQLQSNGLFSGQLSTISLSSYTVTGKFPISDGNHTHLLFADDNTLWIGASQCASGVRAAAGQNTNCLTRAVYDGTTGAITGTPGIIPNVTPGGTATVPFPNTDGNQYYYGNLTGLCWVQTFHKVYTAYGGQVHAFNTGDGSEIDNTLLAVQGTALDVAYIDATTNAAN